MAQVCGLGLLLVLLLSVAGASMPGTVVRINMAALNYVSEIGRAPLQRALQVTIPYFLDQSGETLQPTSFPDRGEKWSETWIQIRNVVVPHLHLNFVADLGIHMSATANFTFQIFRASKPLELMLPVVLLADARVAQGSIGTPVVSISACFSRFGHASVFDGSNSTAAPALLVPVQKHIKAVLRNKICLSISNLVQGLNVHLGTLIGLNPVGPESQIRYYMTDAPTVTSDCISLDINAILFLLGKPIVLPKDATRFTLPPDMGTTDTMVTVGISQHMFDSTFLLLQKAGTLNLDVTGHLESDDNPLNTSALGRLIPEVAHQFPEPRPLVLKVRLGATPVATLRTNNAMLRLQPFVEVLVPASNSAFQSLFSLDVVVNLTLQLSVSKVRLQATTSVLGDVQLTVASSNVGFIDIDQVHKLVGTVFEKPLLDHLNALLGIGLALPNVVNLFYANPEVFVHEGYVVISSGLSYQH